MNQPLSPEQLLLKAAGHVLVGGGPGSGKTTIALNKALACIQAGLKPGQAVLFLSFSRAAVARLVQAGAKAIPPEHRQRLSVQTFHGFCWSLLQCHGYLLGAPSRLQILMPHDERALSFGVTPDDNGWPAWIKERERLFVENGNIVFDLFAPKLLRLIRESNHVKRLIAQRFPIIIVDEAQDTGQDAWEIICALKDASQVVCLADPDQQIFDHLPGVGPERIEAIRQTLRPLELDLGQQNNRSPGTEIAVFGNDILNGRVRGAPYNGVSRFVYNPRKFNLSLAIRQCLAIVYRKCRKRGVRPESCAILAPTGKDVAFITAALSGGARPVPHKVVFDEAEALLASRLAAYMLEPKTSKPMTQYVVEALELLANIGRAAGTVGGRKNAEAYRRWAADITDGKKIAKKSLPASLLAMMTGLAKIRFCGDPRIDWVTVKDAFRNSNDQRLTDIASQLDYLVAFGRGRFLAANLSELWASTSSYDGAVRAFDAALAQDSILESSEDLGGVHVMTIHRAKGKQFDGVIVWRKGVPTGANRWHSSFVWRDDAHPYIRSRKILRVAITRARKEVLILDSAFPRCPLLAGHVL
jgi:DNA helicase-2/ATP-dependent DNA helicase PcrA